MSILANQRSGIRPNRLSAFAATLLATLTLGGCEHQNEGATTTGHMLYSTTENAKDVSTPYTTQLDRRFFLPAEASQLSLINAKDAYSVHIISTFICDFHEWSFNLTYSNAASTACHNGSGGSSSSGDTGTRGEIAILMNVAERN
ncbi:MAG: hypothetical protein RLN89_12655, partial [Parvibaculum sp.]